MTRWPECLLEIALYSVCSAVVITMLLHACRGWQAHQHDERQQHQDDEHQDDEPPPISMVRTSHRAERADRRAP